MDCMQTPLATALLPDLWRLVGGYCGKLEPEISCMAEMRSVDTLLHKPVWARPGEAFLRACEQDNLDAAQWLLARFRLLAISYKRPNGRSLRNVALEVVARN